MESLRFLFVFVLTLSQCKSIMGQEFLWLPHEKCSISPSVINMIEDLKTMVTRMYERHEKLRLDGENATLSNTNAIRDLQTMVTRMYERDEKLRIEAAHVTLNNTNTIRDLKSMINRMYERDEKLRIESDNSTLSNTNAIQRLQTMVNQLKEQDDHLGIEVENATLSNTNAIRDFQTMVTRMYERDEKLRIESANVTLNNTNTIRDLKSMINQMYERDENLRIEVENATNAIRDLQTMVTQLQKRDEEQRLDGENASLSNNNNAYAIRDLQTMVTELYERDEKLSLDWENATFFKTNAIRDLKTDIVELQAKAIYFTNSTTKVDLIRNIYDLLKLSREGKLFIQDEMAYFVSDKRLSWSQAWSFCRSKDAILVNILDSSMSRYITATIAGYGDDFWIGGIKVSGVYSWKTESGYNPITWFNWVPGEPNRSSQNCIQLWKEQGHRWDNDFCRDRKRFLCGKTLI